MEFPRLNDDETKRIMRVIERDFQLRQKEFERIEVLKRVIDQGHQHAAHLGDTKELNSKRCIRCYQLFQRFFNPKEFCSECQLNVCRKCAVYNKDNTTWACQLCLEMKELESLTGDWFYLQTGEKYKRCGSAKVVRELHKREKQLLEGEEDPGYGTVSIGSGTYVVHDKDIRNELNEYAKRLATILDNLQANFSNRSKSKSKEHLKDHQQQLVSEINRTRVALSGPIRRSNSKLTIACEHDLQSLIIHKTEEVLHINLQQFQKSLTTQKSANFDLKLAQLIVDNCPSQIEIDQHHKSCEKPSNTDTFRKMSLMRSEAIDQEDENTDAEAMRKSNARFDDWKLNSTLIQSKMVPLEEEFTTWL